MKNFRQFGEIVEGYRVPVLNEREIRAAAGILFLLLFTAAMLIFLENNFHLFKYAVTIFMIDILIRVLINPKLAPSMIIGAWAVRNQTPEYVGAPQKKFAWIIGAVLSSTIFTFLVVFNGFSPITGIACLICLIFLFFETAFGICLGCKFYPLFFKQDAEYCAGDVCTTSTTNRTSWTQVFAVIVFALFVFTTAIFFDDNFSSPPYDMFGLEEKFG